MLPAVLVCAYEDQLDRILCLHCKRYCFLVVTIRAKYILTSCQCWVLDALRVDFHFLSAHGEIRPVDAVVHLVAVFGAHIVVANLADKLEVAPLFAVSVLLGI